MVLINENMFYLQIVLMLFGDRVYFIFHILLSSFSTSNV